jgi:adenylate cyclase
MVEERAVSETRKLAAILVADVVGYSRLTGTDEDRTLARLRALRSDLIDPTIAVHHGRVVKRTGDGALVEFRSVVDAVRCAVEVQRGMVERNGGLPPERRIEFRVGIHLGDVVEESDGDLMGDGVNIASRLEGVAAPGAICLSEDAYRQVKARLDLSVSDLGETKLKNIIEPMRIYSLQVGVAAEAKPTMQAEIDASEKAPARLDLPDKPSIAVLPFTNMSGDPEQEYFSDGLTEDIITALSRVRSFFVIARNSTFTYKGRAVDVAKVGRELGVRYILEGSVRKAGNRVRITAQLIEAMSSHHVWADRFDGELADIFDLQDQVTASVVGAIEPSLNLAEIERAKAKPTENLNAYDLYLRALPNYYARTKSGSDDVLRLLRKAISLDPSYAIAKALIAACIATRDNQNFMNDDTETAEGIRVAREALETGRDDPGVLQFAGFALSYLAKDYEAGLAALDRALALNANSAQAYNSSGWVRAFSGDWRTAVEHLKRALRLSPLDLGIGLTLEGLAVAYEIAGDYEEALKYGMRSLREMPQLASTHRHVAASLALLGRTEEARDAVRGLLVIEPGSTISSWSKHIPYRDLNFVERFVRGLREAGLPE